MIHGKQILSYLVAPILVVIGSILGSEYYSTSDNFNIFEKSLICVLIYGTYEAFRWIKNYSDNLNNTKQK